MLCGLSKPRAFRMMTQLIIWLHLFMSVFLVLGVASDDANFTNLCTYHKDKNYRYEFTNINVVQRDVYFSSIVAFDGIIMFYVICCSALLIIPQLLALHGVYKKEPFFMVPYIVALLTMVSLFILAVVIIILGMIFDPQRILSEWTLSETTDPTCESSMDMWLTTLIIGIVIVIMMACIFVVFSYYKILLKQEEINELLYIETYLPSHRAIPQPVPGTVVGKESPPPSYSRAQSMIGQTFV